MEGFGLQLSYLAHTCIRLIPFTSSRLPFQWDGPSSQRVDVKSVGVQCRPGSWGSPWLDLFATRVNHRLPLYVSPMQDLHAWSRRSVVLVAEPGRLRVSAVCSDPQDPGQDPEGLGSSNSDRPILALQELVLSSNGTAGRASSQATRVRSATVTAQRKSSLSKRRKTIP